MTALMKLREDLAKTGGNSLANVLAQRAANPNPMLLLDVSGSMAGAKIHSLREIADSLRAQFPRVRQIAFSDVPEFVETVPPAGGGTNLTEAIYFAQHNDAKHLIVVSDGMPDNVQSAMFAAKAFRGPIDVFYVGPRPSAGEEFLRDLAHASGGSYEVMTLTKEPKLLEQKIAGLLKS